MRRTRPIRTLAALSLLASALAAPPSAPAFSGFGQGVGCSPLVSDPQRFVRLRAGASTYRISANYQTWYPDDFSQYLVRDVAALWEAYISAGYDWSDDIEDRFSYWRDDPDQPVYELKTVLLHEFGHALGMQHSDACFYNINGATMAPWNSNHRLGPGGVPFVQATVGPELMNEKWTASSPGQKFNGPIDGYNRVPGQDDWEFVNYAYPFQSISLDEILAGTPMILVDSTAVASSGGQATYPGGYTQIDAGDPDQGWWIDGVNLWVGNQIGIKSRADAWWIENDTGSDITQVTLRVDRASTRRAIDESAPGEFFHFGTGTTSSPEQLVHAWSATLQDPWPAGSTELFWLSLDVHDWTVSEALMWFTSNQAWPIPLPGIMPLGPWGLTSPHAPPPGQELPLAAPAGAPSEPTPAPTDIELVRPSSSRPPTGGRGLRLVLPAVPGTTIERLEAVPLPWDRAELLAMDGGRRRAEQLARLFEEGGAGVVDLLAAARPAGAAGVAPEAAGLRPDPALSPSARTAADGREPAAPLAASFALPFGREVTYAVRATAATDKTRATLVSLPEMTRYSGTRAARCAWTGDAAACCPPGLSVAKPGDPAAQSRCRVTGPGADTLTVPTGAPQLVATGDGADRVASAAADSLVFLGRGDDTFTAAAGAPARALGGEGADRLTGSQGPDLLEGGPGADRIDAGDGDDEAIGGAGGDEILGGPGDDAIYPGSGADRVDAGAGDDRVVFLHPCELDGAKVLRGGAGRDTLVLPVSAAAARARGVDVSDFERIVEDAPPGAGRFADCEGAGSVPAHSALQSQLPRSQASDQSSAMK